MVHQEQALHVRLLPKWGWYSSPENHIFPGAFSLKEPCSNNVAEYNALLIGLQLTQQMGVQYLKAYGYSKLIVSQNI